MQKVFISPVLAGFFCALEHGNKLSGTSPIHSSQEGGLTRISVFIARGNSKEAGGKFRKYRGYIGKRYITLEILAGEPKEETAGEDKLNPLFILFQLSPRKG